VRRFGLPQLHACLPSLLAGEKVVRWGKAAHSIFTSGVNSGSEWVTGMLSAGAGSALQAAIVKDVSQPVLLACGMA
jgi:hypothetical protein